MKTCVHHPTRALCIDGKTVEVALYGPAPDQAPTLVFLHEGLGCVSLWRDFPTRLAQATGCGAFVYSRVGYGKSDTCSLPRPISFMHDEGLDFFPKLIEAAGLQEHVLVGHSDGGSIALIYAGGTPATGLRGLITEAPHVFCEEVCTRSIHDIVTAYHDGDLRERLKKHHGSNVDCAFWGWADVWQHPDFKQWNIEEYLPHIKVPLMIIQGEDDEYATIAPVRALTRQAGAGAESLLLPDCKHSPHKDQEGRTLAAMVEFIRKVLR